MLLEAPTNLAPRIVELDRLLQIATRFIRMHADNLRPVKLARLFQNLQMIDFAQPKRSVFTQLSDVKHLLRHPQRFQQANYVSSVPGASCVLAPGYIMGH